MIDAMDGNDLEVSFRITEAASQCGSPKRWRGIMTDGTHFFYGSEVYGGFPDKWNWLVLQAFYGGQPYIDIIDTYVQKLTDGCVAIDWSLVERADDSMLVYISHRYVNAEEAFRMPMENGISMWLVNDVYKLKLSQLNPVR